MIRAISLADHAGTDVVWHENANRVVTYQEGLFGMSSLRSVKRSRPTGHGALNDSKWTDGHMIVLRGDVDAGSDEATLADFRQLSAVCQDTLDYGPALLKWSEGTSGLDLQRAVKFEAGMDPPQEGGNTVVIQYEAQFFAEDPRAYSQTLTTVSSSALSTASGGLTFPMRFPITFTPSGGGTASVTNNGNRYTPPVFKVYGMCVNPAIVNMDTDEKITLEGTIANGDYIEIDVANRTVKLNGGTRLDGFLDSANTDWFELPSGTSNLQMTSGTFDGTAKFDTLFRDAYA